MIRIGVDTGGTFTDFVFWDGEKISIQKIPSTPANPARAILEGLAPYMDKEFELIHGTTVSTNAFLQKKLAKTAFLCTAGFEHLLHIGRQNRVNLFSLKAEKPASLVPLSLCFPVSERTFKDGTIQKQAEAGELEEICRQLKEQDVTAVGVVFLHSYKNPENEKLAAKILRDQGFYVTASHEVMPEYREYERAVVTVLNSALKPVIADYVAGLQKALEGKGLLIIQSNGGVLSPARIVDDPIRTIISGPAGGVIAARRIAGLKNYNNLITLDMGGTSTDVSVIKEGEITLSREGTVEHLPIRLPMIDIATVGAGGGSIARIDRGGVLQVGPESAGADPGPACYGKSELATVTDAFAVMGAILPDMFLGGRMEIFPQRSRQVIGEIAEKIGKSLEETAEGIVRISISSMERALRSVTLEKGEDPRFYSLMPFGGAGGLAAALLAERLGIEQILIPPNQGVFSALGMLVADLKKDLHQSFLKMYYEGIHGELDKLFAEMTAQANSILDQEGFKGPGREILSFLDIRYKGQSYELTVPYTRDFIKTFHQQHQQLYSYIREDDHCEIVNLRVLAMGRTGKLGISKHRLEPGEAPVYAQKEVYWAGETRSFDIYRREELRPGNNLTAPAIVVSRDATVVVAPHWQGLVDEYENILLNYEGKQGQGE